MRRLALLAAGLAAWAPPALAKPVELNDSQLDAVTAGANFSQTNLVADRAGQALNTDPNLVNSWGVAQSPTGPLWVADNGTGLATVYSNNGTPQPLVVTVPSASSGTGTPTGAVFNGNANDFTVSSGGNSGGATFLFATEDGTIAGWNAQVSPTSAVTAINNSATGAVYKGLTIAQVGSNERLYAADFSKNAVEVFDSQFHLLAAFTDPNLPSGFAPFDVQNINGALYVSFAKQDAAHHDDVAGQGNGFVDVFNTDGTLIRRLISRGQLNSPWGMTLAPANFGNFGGALLVGNFGNGRINAYNPVNGAFLGRVNGANNQPLSIDGLWSLLPAQGNASTVVFSAGPNSEKNGLLGIVQALPKTNPPKSAVVGAPGAVSTASTGTVTIPSTTTGTPTTTMGSTTGSTVASSAATGTTFPPVSVQVSNAAMNAAANSTVH